MGRETDLAWRTTSSTTSHQFFMVADQHMFMFCEASPLLCLTISLGMVGVARTECKDAVTIVCARVW